MRTARIACVMMLIAYTGGCAHFVSPPGPALPDRPGYTDGPLAMPKNAMQLELGTTYDHTDAVDYTTIGEILYRLGVGSRTELRVFGNSYAIRSPSGLSTVRGVEDPKIGIKTNLHTNADDSHGIVPNIAVLAATTLPIGADAFSASKPQPEAKLAASWNTGTPLSLYSNLGAGAVYDGVEWGERGWASLALWYAVSARASLFGEGLAIRPLHGDGGGLRANNADAGITWLVNDRFQIDFRAGRGFGSTSGSERFVGVGVTRRW